MKSDRKKILLEKLIKNECSREELEELLSLKGSSEFDEQFGEVLDREWEKIKHINEMNPSKGDEIFYDIINRESKAGKARISSFGYLYKVAAVFIVLVLFSGLFYWFQSGQNLVTESTAYGQTKEIQLSDGSTVILNGNSSVTYKRSWNDDEERILNLRGEAFFKVTHKTNNQKFLVKAENIKVEVLGTEFNVKSRASSSAVVLKSGKVRLAVKGKEDILMKPGQLVELFPNTNEINNTKVNVTAYTSWKDNLLTFQSSSLIEISKMVEETYGVKIEIEDATLANERFTGVFPVNGNLEDLYYMLSKAYDFKVIKKSDKIIFKR